MKPLQTVKAKPLWKISIVSTPEAEDAVSELLESELNEASVAYTDVETNETTIATYPSVKPDWPKLRRQLAQGLIRIKSCGLNIGRARLSLQKIRREDWAESWKRHFKPLEIGATLLIKPSWSKRSAKTNQATVILDPGLSFGTGQHPTTSFCLRLLVAHHKRYAKSSQVRQKPSFLDIGTGSGILAISAAKVGYAPVEAFDFDPEAVRIAAENARKNRVKGIKLYRADLTKLPKGSPRKFDVVCANLISTLLISERNRILSRLKPNGVLIVAGILASEFAQVQTHFEKAGLRMITGRTEKEWRSGAFTR